MKRFKNLTPLVIVLLLVALLAGAIQITRDDEILGSTGTVTIGGRDNTNNETLAWDYETTANTVDVTSGTGVTVVDFNTLDISTDAIQLGHASDTTLARSAAGVVTIEGAQIVETDGTGTNNELAVWTDSGTLEGDANLLWTGDTLFVTSPSVTAQALSVTGDFGILDYSAGSIATNAEIFNLSALDDLTTGFVFKADNLDGLTTGRGLWLAGQSRNLTTGELIDTDWTASGTLANKTGNLWSSTVSRTSTRTSGTTADNYDQLSISRTDVQNGAGGTFTSTGALLRAAYTATQTAGTLTPSPHLVELVNDADNAGDSINVTHPGTGDAIDLSAGPIRLGSAGVLLDEDGDGQLSIAGLGNGSDEDWTINLDDTANTVVHGTTTGVTVHDWGSIQGAFGSLDVSDGDITNADNVYLNQVESDDGSSGIHWAGHIVFTGGSGARRLLLDTADGSDNRFLQVSGGGGASETRGGFYAIYGNEVTNFAGTIFLQAGDVATSGTRDGRIVFNTAGSDRGAWDADGEFGIGTISPSEDLHVVGNARITAIASGAFSSSVNQTSDGTLTDQTSDERLKTDFADIDDALAKVLELKPVMYRWKTAAEFRADLRSGKIDLPPPAEETGFEWTNQDRTVQCGLVAQQVMKVIPEVVRENKADGFLALDYDELTPVLIAAIKEQQRQIDLLYRFLRVRKP